MQIGLFFHFSFAITLRITSNGIIKNAIDITNHNSRKVSGTHLKTSPPKYIIIIWIADIVSITRTNPTFFVMFDKIHIRSHLATKQLNIVLQTEAR